MAIACLAKVSPLNPSTGSRVDLYIASAQDRAVTGLNGVVWEPAMTAPPTLSINLWQGDFREPVDTGGASFSINMGILKMTYAGCDAYNWAGAPVEIYAEEPGTAWPWATRFKGRVASYSRRNDVLTINATIETEAFDKNILTTTYAGTGGAEGGADLKGRLKPLVIGWAQNVEPILIDTVNNVYQFSGYGAIEAVSVLYERAASFGASIGDYATYADLVAAAIPAGRWGTCLASGMVRLGAPAAGVITGDVRGHRVGSTTPRLTGAVISALATIAGVSTANIETSTLTSLDTAVPYPINLVLTEQIEWRDMAAQLALACNWQSGITLPGKWFTLAVSLSGSEVITLNAQGTALPQVATSDEADVSPPYYQTIFGANRSWRVHTADEIAFTAQLVPLGRYASGTTYREGNIVDLADGSTWLYINPVASSGNAPPAWPTASNSFWSNLTPPTVPGSIGAATTGDVAAAATTAVWSGVSGAGKPADNATRNVVTYSATAPSSPVDGDLWVDLSGTFAVFKLRSGGSWVTGANALSAYNSLSGTPVALADINTTESSKLAGIQSGATRNIVTYSATAPSSPQDGDLWVDTSGTYAVFKLRSGGSWQTGANALSAYNALSGKPVALADINTTESSKLSGIQAGATVGAPTGTPVGTITAGDVSSTINSGGGVANNQVSTPAIQDNALTAGAQASAGSGTMSAGGTVDGVSVAYTVVSGRVRVDICLDAWRSSGATLSGYVQLIRTKGGVDTLIGRSLFIYGFSGDFSPIVYWGIDNPGAGAVTYRVRFTRDSGTGTLAYANQAISIAEFKDQRT